jgi:hypothetical protein
MFLLFLYKRVDVFIKTNKISLCITISVKYPRNLGLLPHRLIILPEKGQVAWELLYCINMKQLKIKANFFYPRDAQVDTLNGRHFLNTYSDSDDAIGNRFISKQQPLLFRVSVEEHRPDSSGQFLPPAELEHDAI